MRPIFFIKKRSLGAQQGRLIHPSGSIFETSKKRRFFDVDLEGQIDKNRALEPQGSKKVVTGEDAYKPRGDRGPQAGGQLSKKYKEKTQGAR